MKICENVALVNLLKTKKKKVLTTDMRNSLDEGIEDTKLGLVWHSLSK
jgi:hypothetical protein